MGTVPCTGVCDGCTRQPQAVRSSPAGLVMRRIFDELVLHELLHEVVGGSASVSESRFSSTASRASVSDRQIGSSPAGLWTCWPSAREATPRGTLWLERMSSASSPNTSARVRTVSCTFRLRSAKFVQLVLAKQCLAMELRRHTQRRRRSPRGAGAPWSEELRSRTTTRDEHVP